MLKTQRKFQRPTRDAAKDGVFASRCGSSRVGIFLSRAGILFFFLSSLLLVASRPTRDAAEDGVFVVEVFAGFEGEKELRAILVAPVVRVREHPSRLRGATALSQKTARFDFRGVDLRESARSILLSFETQSSSRSSCADSRVLFVHVQYRTVSLEMYLGVFFFSYACICVVAEARVEFVRERGAPERPGSISRAFWVFKTWDPMSLVRRGQRRASHRTFSEKAAVSRENDSRRSMRCLLPRM